MSGELYMGSLEIMYDHRDADGMHRTVRHVEPGDETVPIDWASKIVQGFLEDVELRQMSLYRRGPDGIHLDTTFRKISKAPAIEEAKP